MGKNSRFHKRKNSDYLAILILTGQMYQLNKTIEVQKAKIQNFKRVEEEEVRLGVHQMYGFESRDNIMHMNDEGGRSYLVVHYCGK